MDPKSTAKSKRIHSLHGRKNHPTSKKKPSSSSSSSSSRYDKLPSNWTRYNDNNEDDYEEIGENEVLVRSKGADYAYLIEEAGKQEVIRVSNSSLRQDEFKFDFLRGSGLMLSTRGESLINWCEDDNFIVDDDNSSNYEISALSMDLKALSGQLSKLNMSHRLFMQDFLFSDELEKCHNTGYKSESNIPTHNSKLSSKEPEIGSNLSDEISIEMVQSLIPKSEQEENINISNNVILDDALDDLLAETSIKDANNYEKGLSNKDNTNSKDKDGNNYEKGLSKMDNNNKMADVLDDLLEENLVDLKRGNEIEAEKRVDDFDSWFDSL